MYALKVPCGMVYVGQTKRPLKDRVAEHKTAIRVQNMDYAIARHYKDAGHGSPATLQFWGLEKVEESPRGGDHNARLLRRESHWVFKLNCVQPYGLNDSNNLSCYP